LVAICLTKNIYFIENRNFGSFFGIISKPIILTKNRLAKIKFLFHSLNMLKPSSLKNGINIARIPRANCNTVVVGLVVNTGSIVEEGYFPQGISRLVERMFWRGTYKHSSSKHLNLALESMGGSFYSFTTQETMQFYITVPAVNQYKAISFLAEIIQRSYFDARDVENEKKILIEEQKQSNQDMGQEIQDISLANLYSNSSLGLPVNGFIESINQIEHAQVLDYLSHQFIPEKTTIVIAGNFDSKKTIELLEQEWSIWNPKTKKFIEPDLIADEVRDLPKIHYRQRGVAQTYLAVNFILDEGLKPILIMQNPEGASELVEPTQEMVDGRLQQMAILLVLNSILGQGFSSRLWTKGIEEELLFNKVESNLNYFSNTSFISIIGNTENLQFSFGLECIMSTLDSLKRTAVSINELAKAKEYLKGRFILEHENLLSHVLWQMDNYVNSSVVYEISDILEKIDRVDSAQVRSMALDLFVPQRLSISTLGTAKETRLVDKLIKKYLGV
jgi:predicted Zn-dependent peptidase